MLQKPKYNIKTFSFRKHRGHLPTKADGEFHGCTAEREKLKKVIEIRKCLCLSRSRDSWNYYFFLFAGNVKAPLSIRRC